MKKKEYLESTLAAVPQEPYPVHSRVHPLKSFNTHAARCFVKRDDELGFGISGSKIRKYRSLVPFFLKNKIEEVIVIGGSNSNNVLGIVQLLIENKIRPTLFLKRTKAPNLQGNFLLTSMLVSSESIHWIESGDWKNVIEKVQTYTKELPRPYFILNEGSSVTEAFPGALSLPLDILRNEEELKHSFDHVFIDSGTGMMASALILGLHWMEKPTLIHVLLLAESEEEFLKNLHDYHQNFMKLLQIPLPFPTNFILYKPITGKSFGGTNPAIFEEIVSLARAEGFLTDPIYTAKLFTEARTIIREKDLEGHVLINHSGGGLSLSGFQEQIREIVK